MSDILTLKDIVNDYLQTTSPSVLNQTLELNGDAAAKVTLVDKLILRAANNARKWAEKKHDFSWNDMTLAGQIPINGVGLGLNRELYQWPHKEFGMNVNGVTGSGTISSYYLHSKVRVGSVFWVINTGYAGTWTTAKATVASREVNGWTIVCTFTDGTPEANAQYFYVNFDFNLKQNHRQIKTLHSCFLADENHVGSVPLRIERKARLTSRLIENYEAQDASQTLNWSGQRMINHGNRLYLYPNNEAVQNVLVDANVWAYDYIDDSSTDEFLQHGFEFMQWATIVEVNRLLQTYVARQEGNIAPPNNDRDRALKELIDFDIYQSEVGDIQMD